MTNTPNQMHGCSHKPNIIVLRIMAVFGDLVSNLPRREPGASKSADQELCSWAVCCVMVPGGPGHHGMVFYTIDGTPQTRVSFGECWFMMTDLWRRKQPRLSFRAKLGMVMLVLGAMHFLNLFVFSKMRKRALRPPVALSAAVPPLLPTTTGVKRLA